MGIRTDWQALTKHRSLTIKASKAGDYASPVTEGVRFQNSDMKAVILRKSFIVQQKQQQPLILLLSALVERKTKAPKPERSPDKVPRASATAVLEKTTGEQSPSKTRDLLE